MRVGVRKASSLKMYSHAWSVSSSSVRLWKMEQRGMAWSKTSFNRNARSFLHARWPVTAGLVFPPNTTKGLICIAAGPFHVHNMTMRQAHKCHVFAEHGRLHEGSYLPWPSQRCEQRP